MSKNEKFLYVWRLARFLNENKTRMSGKELSEHLNRNKIKTSYDTAYGGGRGTYRLISAVWNWIHNELGLPEKAEMVAKSFVDSNDLHAYE